MTFVYFVVGSLLGVLAGGAFILLFAYAYWLLEVGLPSITEKLGQKLGEDVAETLVGVGIFVALCGIIFGVPFSLYCHNATPPTTVPAVTETVNPQE